MWMARNSATRWVLTRQRRTASSWLRGGEVQKHNTTTWANKHHDGADVGMRGSSGPPFMPTPMPTTSTVDLSTTSDQHGVGNVGYAVQEANQAHLAGRENGQARFPAPVLSSPLPRIADT